MAGRGPDAEACRGVEPHASGPVRRSGRAGWPAGSGHGDEERLWSRRKTKIFFDNQDLDVYLAFTLARAAARGASLGESIGAASRVRPQDPASWAALLAETADGLRGRVSLRAWPLLRRDEAELVAQVRQALGVDQFDEPYAAGSRLSQQEAVAAVRGRGGAGTTAP